MKGYQVVLVDYFASLILNVPAWCASLPSFGCRSWDLGAFVEACVQGLGRCALVVIVDEEEEGASWVVGYFVRWRVEREDPWWSPCDVEYCDSNFQHGHWCLAVAVLASGGVW